MKRVCKRAPLGQSTSAQISTVLSPPFFLSSVRWDQKAQMCNILRTYTGSSHTNNHKIPEGQVMLAILNTSRMCFCIMTNKTLIKIIKDLLQHNTHLSCGHWQCCQITASSMVDKLDLYQNLPHHLNLHFIASSKVSLFSLMPHNPFASQAL